MAKNNTKKESKQKEALMLSGDLWNKFMEIDVSEKNPDDNNDVRHHIHAIQNILYTQLYIKENGKL